MAEIRMSQSIKVLDHKRVDLKPGKQTFVLVDEDEPHNAEATLEITDEDWHDFGRPSQLTITIVPGDMLNVDG